MLEPQPLKSSIMPGRTTQPTISSAAISALRRRIYRYYQSHGRRLPWRATRNPYHILVSEIMLQQTQVDRVAEKYRQFITAFPDFRALAEAPLQDILRVWQGMGYNRRALYLKKIAAEVAGKFSGRLPRSAEQLAALPGIGKNTAASIAAFAFNQPVVFIETNIRSVFIHFFFNDRTDVHDREILPLVEKALVAKKPRQWYSALMDYGTMLKKTRPNPSRRSAHHQKQSRFEGSNRQVRGLILRILTDNPRITEVRLVTAIPGPAIRVKQNLDGLEKEGFIKRKGGKLSIV